MVSGDEEKGEADNRGVGGWTRVCVCGGGVSGLGWASTVAEQQERRCHGDRQEEGEGARVHGEPCSGGGGGVG